MAKFAVFIFAFFGFLKFSLADNYLDQCDAEKEKEIQKCLDPMIKYASEMQSQSVLPSEGLPIFEAMCTKYYDFQGCIDNTKCRNPSIDAIQASYGYMCGPEKEQFQRYVECFVKVEGSPEYKECKTAATSSLANLRMDNARPSSYFDEMCTTMQKYMQCSKASILQFCDTNAWTLVTRITRDSLKVTMPKCDLEHIFKMS